MSDKFDLYQTATDRIVKLMSEHGSNWMNPFKKSSASYAVRNPITGKAYQGMNQFLLGTTEFSQPYWAGFGQWKDKGAIVKRGQKSTMIVYWKILEKIVDGKKTTRPLLRYLNVFNVAQVEAVSEAGEKFLATLTAPIEPLTLEEKAQAIADADAFIAATGATIRHSNEDRAYYSTMLDGIHMPNRSLFSATKTSTATEAYYGTALHELTHWTGHSSRLNRDLANRFGSEAYAFEELVAELGAAMLCAQLGISVEPRADHAQYLNNWLKVLKNDKHAIIKAAGLAKAAAAFLSKSSEEEEEVLEAA